MQSLLNMVNGVEQTSGNPIIFSVGFLLNVAYLCYTEEQHFSYRQVWGFFLDSNAHVAATENISLHWMSDWGLEIKIDNTVVIPSYT